ncbi:Aminoacylase-1 [Hyaloraphidium curvatum]|nr:Aminoacylase-1 [Hyaloraphidium curvatum]
MPDASGPAEPFQFHPSRAVSRFQEFLRIKTVQPEPDYKACSEWLRGQAEELGLRYAEYNPSTAGYKPVVILTWPSSRPEPERKKSILLNTHTDVVPCDPSRWTLADPFSAAIVAGEIVARGAQDMKCVGAAQLSAVAALKASGWDNPSPRDLHFAFTPDEEIGGKEGWGLFVDTPEFDALDVGFEMDEGIADPDPEGLEVFYAERIGAAFRVTAKGNAGHASQFIKDTAAAKLVAFAGAMLKLRDEQQQILAEGVHPDGTKYALGDVTTINLTLLGGGKQVNVVPNELEMTFDVRVTPRVGHPAFTSQLLSLAASHGVELSFLRPPVIHPLLPVSDPLYARWWAVVRREAEKRGLEPRPRVFSAATDARYLRRKGIPSLGCSFLAGCPVLLHDHDERLPVETYERGVAWYVDVLRGLAEVDGE